MHIFHEWLEFKKRRLFYRRLAKAYAMLVSPTHLKKYMYNPFSDLFSKVIPMGGSASCEWATNTAEDVRDAAMERAMLHGWSPPANGKPLVDWVRSRSHFIGFAVLADLIATNYFAISHANKTTCKSELKTSSSKGKHLFFRSRNLMNPLASIHAGRSVSAISVMNVH